MGALQRDRMMAKRLSIILLVGLLSLLLSVPALAAYYISIDVTESNGTDYDMLAMNVSMDVDYLVAHQFITADGTDVRVKNSQGTELPFMLADDKLMFALPVTASKTTGLEMTNDNSVLSSFPVITGHSGYVTITDHANLELSNNFELEWDGYVDTTVSGDLISKTDAFDVSSDGAGHIDATIYKQADIEQTQQSTSMIIHGAGGAYTRAAERVNNVAAAYTIKVSYYLQKVGNPTGTAYVRVRQVSDDSIVGTIGTVDVSTLGTNWYDFTGSIYNPIAQDLRFTFEYSGGDSSNYIVARYYSDVLSNAVNSRYDGSWSDYGTADTTIKIYYGPSASVTATVPSGEHTIKVAADGSTLKIYKDGVEEDSTTVIGTINNANNWVLGSDAIPYFNSYTHTTSDTLRITYEPDDIISGTTLPNEENPGTYDGTITWGSNPAGIAISTSGLKVEEEYYYTGGGTGGGGDIFEPEPAQLISGVDLDKLSHNPFAPLVNGIAEGSGGLLPAAIVWIGGAWFILIAAGTALIILMREHLVFAAAVSMGLAIAFYLMGIFDYWVLIVLGILLGASIVHERTPTW